MVGKTLWKVCYTQGGYGTNVMGFLFWLAVKGILSSVIGNSFYNWFKQTKYGIWFDKKFTALLNKVTHKHKVAESNRPLKVAKK